MSNFFQQHIKEEYTVAKKTEEVNERNENEDKYVDDTQQENDNTKENNTKAEMPVYHSIEYKNDLGIKPHNNTKYSYYTKKQFAELQKENEAISIIGTLATHKRRNALMHIIGTLQTNNNAKSAINVYSFANSLCLRYIYVGNNQFIAIPLSIRNITVVLQCLIIGILICTQYLHTGTLFNCIENIAIVFAVVLLILRS